MLRPAKHRRPESPLLHQIGCAPSVGHDASHRCPLPVSHRGSANRHAPFPPPLRRDSIFHWIAIRSTTCFGRHQYQRRSQPLSRSQQRVANRLGKTGGSRHRIRRPGRAQLRSVPASHRSRSDPRKMTESMRQQGSTQAGLSRGSIRRRKRGLPLFLAVPFSRPSVERSKHPNFIGGNAF